MTAKESDHLRQLLTTFDARSLGEGDEVAGANTLAAMACVLADLAPTDDTIRTRDGKPARVGVNLLVTGPASAGLVVDEVLLEVGRRQRNLWHHLVRYAECIEQQRRKPGASLPPTDPKAGSSENRVAETQYELEPPENTRPESWGKIFNKPLEEDVAALCARPKFLLSLTRPGDLDVQLRGLRPGHTLVHAGCTRPKDLSALAESGAALIEGRYTLGNGCETARGHFLITDPLQVLAKAAKDPDDDTAWLGHFLWLCDGKAGPCAPSGGSANDGPEMITTRFCMALDNVLARRMNVPVEEFIPLSLDTREAKVRFREFLDDMESRLPGISLAAKNLIDTLAFGLGRMAAIARLDPRSYDAASPFNKVPVEGLEKRLPLSVAGIEALARFLVHRMANARMVMIHAGAVEQRQSQIRRIFRKLQQGPVESRKLYRNLGLTAADCDESLHWMERAGLIWQMNRKWALEDGAVLRFEDHSIPLLEI
ncbi:MAG: hypothetical protein KFF45_07185 [Thioalkalivibrio sp.]|nr:hypothetical protein [Thioalkalivibrio sp.]